MHVYTANEKGDAGIMKTRDIVSFFSFLISLECHITTFTIEDELWKRVKIPKNFRANLEFFLLFSIFIRFYKIIGLNYEKE